MMSSEKQNRIFLVHSGAFEENKRGSWPDPFSLQVQQCGLGARLRHSCIWWALFLGLLWLQFLIGSSMPKWRGKAWEIQSHTMTLDRQKVDTQRAMPNRRNSRSLRWSASNLPNNELYWHCLSNAVVKSPLTRYIYRKGLALSGTAPLSVYLLLCHNMYMTKSPRPSPSVFAYCKWWNNVAGEGLGMRLWWASICIVDLVAIWL